MDRRSFLRLFAAAGPVAAVAPVYFFAPVGGWRSDVIMHAEAEVLGILRRMEARRTVLMVSNPSPESWVKIEFINAENRIVQTDIPRKLWGLQYTVSHPPYIADEYMGISRSAYPMKRRP